MPEYSVRFTETFIDKNGKPLELRTPIPVDAMTPELAIAEVQKRLLKDSQKRIGSSVTPEEFGARYRKFTARKEKVQ